MTVKGSATRSATRRRETPVINAKVAITIVTASVTRIATRSVASTNTARIRIEIERRTRKDVIGIDRSHGIADDETRPI